MKSQDRLAFLLGAIPFLAVGFGTLDISDWKFGSATLLLALYNVLASIFSTRFSVLMKTLLWATNTVMAAVISYDFSTTGEKSLTLIWAAITACYLFALILYRRDTAKKAPGDTSTNEPQR